MTRDDFEEWLAQMDERLDGLLGHLPSGVAEQLDYSPRSLDMLERWLLSQYPSTRALLADEAKVLLDEVVSYVGEVFRRTVGGVWAIDLKDPNNAYFQIPVLEKPGEWIICPVTLTGAAADRRTGRLFTQVLFNTINEIA